MLTQNVDKSYEKGLYSGIGAPHVPSEFVTFSVKALFVTLLVKTLVLELPRPPLVKSSDANREILTSFFAALLDPLAAEGAPLVLVLVPALEKSLEGNDKPGLEPALRRGVSDLSRGWSSPAAIPKHRDCAAANRRNDSVTCIYMRERERERERERKKERKKERKIRARVCDIPQSKYVEYVVVHPI